MARASRHYIPGHIWHLTHRCHKSEFLLKFAKDRFRWMEMLLEARKRFGLSVLNFVVTSNHIHLIVWDNAGRDTIPKSMQLVAGRVGQEYNQRKGRKGAFWEDRYHATAIESGDHLWRCMVYVDLNMVRAGVVDHPSKWRWCGYQEIQQPKKRYRLIDHRSLQRLLFIGNPKELAATHRHWIDMELEKNLARKDCFSKSLAFGSQSFVNKISDAMGLRAKGRHVAQASDEGYQLREPISAYQKQGVKRSSQMSDSWNRGNLLPWDTEIS